MVFSGSPNFHRKEKQKASPSVADGIAQFTLAATTAIAIGVEEGIHKTLGRTRTAAGIQDVESTLEYVKDNIIGNDLVYDGPFGKRTVVYCDYTASGKSVKFIEDYIRDHVLPYYGNTHTTTTVSSLQTSMLRNEAKQIIRKCMNATDEDAVIFVSSGSTGAILKLIHGLELKESPVVFISPFEHHSNLLPWLEIGAEIVYGEENCTGMMNLIKLEEDLKKYSRTGRPLIGSFSAASNITGILNDTEAIATIMHSYNGYAFFDYATAGPYIELDMNPNLSDPRKSSLCYKDAIFCSVHKFVGGPGTPGLLVAKKDVFINPVPSGAGGGTVLFVTHKRHQYVKDIEEREEGGTPAIVESIRAGLVFQLKQEVSPKTIMSQEHRFVELAYAKWDPVPNLHILGKSSADRLPIFSLVFEHPETKRFLHHNFVSSLLNDLFGIQARGGCACAGPYAEDLLSIDSDFSEHLTKALLGEYSVWNKQVEESDLEQVQGTSYSILKPGFARLNLPYFFNMETIGYILDAVIFVAKYGWQFLPMYKMNPATGDFTHKESHALEHASHLTDVRHLLNPVKHKAHHEEKIDIALDFEEALKQANVQRKNYCKSVRNENPLPSDIFLPKSMDNVMRWFLTPSEAHGMLKGKEPAFVYTQMFYPRPAIALLNSNRIQRTRIKSGLAQIKFCKCPVKKGRHVMGESCKRYEIPEDDDANNNTDHHNIDVELIDISKARNVSHQLFGKQEVTFV